MWHTLWARSIVSVVWIKQAHLKSIRNLTDMNVVKWEMCNLVWRMEVTICDPLPQYPVMEFVFLVAFQISFCFYCRDISRPVDDFEKTFKLNSFSSDSDNQITVTAAVTPLHFTHFDSMQAIQNWFNSYDSPLDLTEFQSVFTSCKPYSIHCVNVIKDHFSWMDLFQMWSLDIFWRDHWVHKGC